MGSASIILIGCFFSEPEKDMGLLQFDQGSDPVQIKSDPLIPLFVNDTIPWQYLPLPAQQRQF